MSKVNNCLILLIIASVVLLACENVPKAEPHYIHGFKYKDNSYQKKIIADLKKHDIPIIISDTGFASYPTEFERKVNKILEINDSRPYTEFYNKKHADNFASLLRDNNYEYMVKRLDNSKIQVYWNIENDQDVRELKVNNINQIFKD